MTTTNNFALDEFCNPPSIFWPGYFWILNDRIDENKLLQQLHDMYDHGARSLCLLPEPKEFRPAKFGTELDLPYLSESYFKMIRTVVDECDKLGMNYWLYDEGGWPSGGACGQVYEHDPANYARKGVVFSEQNITKDTAYIVPEDVLCASVGKTVYKPGETIKNTDNDTAIRIFYVKKYSGYPKTGAIYPNLLMRRVTEKFIELTHQRHKEYVGNSFGKSIRFVFTDEPAVPPTNPTDLTWVDDMPEIFQQKKGYDLIHIIPTLLTEPSDDDSKAITQARIDFYDVWSQLFVERYFIPIRDWCRENGLLSGGHIGGEDEPIGNAKYGYGHILRVLRALDLPSIDTIWRQTFPSLRSHPFPKYASSVARQMSQPYVMTESFAVYGNGLTPGEMRWITHQQYVRGVSLMVVACYPYSTREHFMPGERPHFGRVNPLWKYMDIYHAHTARLGYLLTRGNPTCTTALYYDIRSIWAGGSTQKRAIELHEDIAETLLSSQCDFDFIDDDTLAESTSSDGNLSIGTMNYDTVIIPATKWMAPEAIDGLRRFVKSGGNLIAVGGNIDGFDEPVRNVELNELPAMVKPLVRFETPCKDIRVCKRVWDNMSFYLLTSESSEPIKIKALFDEQDPAALCDLEAGKLLALENNELEFEPWGSVAVLFGVEADSKPLQFSAGNEKIELNAGWKLKPIRQYSVGEHDFEIIERTGGSPVDLNLGDWRKVLGEHFSGDAEYAIEFDCPDKFASAPAKLELGDVKYACEVILNGETVGRCVWLPYELNISGKLKPGKNELRIVVTNTLANALLDPKVEKDWYSKTGPGWPSNGVMYDKFSRNFEKDSLPSGLFGPVRIVVSANHK